jgi:periplasmic divalent cation tolerance protein
MAGSSSHPSHADDTTATVVVYVTVPDAEIAKKLAHSIVTSKLAACVNIVSGLESVYLWEGKINSDSELLLMIKSRQALVEELTQHVKQNHPYTECEVIAVPIVGGSASYIRWILDSTKEG